MERIVGQTQALKASHARLLERIARRRVNPCEIVSSELVTFLCHSSFDIGRQLGVLIDRRGAIEQVVVGDAHRLYLPDLGRLREGRFRGLRLVHTHLRSEPLTRDDLTDLAKLRLDLIAAITLRPDGAPGQIFAAHLLPPNPRGALWQEFPAWAATASGVDFLALMRSLEEEFAAHTLATRQTDEGLDRALLVHVTLGNRKDCEARLTELRDLCRTAGLHVLDAIVQRRPQGPDPRLLIGKGKLDDVVMRAHQLDATVLVFDPELTPTQARSVSDLTELKVIDRTMLILDIFAQHAHTRDGKLQVELAQLKYTLPRLIEKNTMMSRLTGGIGGRGPGETKLEINRRRAREKIQQLEKEIALLSRRRSERRSLRMVRGVPVVAIVGYTNAGKSTLLNALTDGNVRVANQLFATLDPTSRRLRFPREREVVLTDTVGFIRDLPKDLVNAFRATLEELAEADLLVHVVDVADPAQADQIRAVERILGELHLDDKRRILVFNKADKIGWERAAELVRDQGGLTVSAEAPNTLRPLLARLERALWEEDRLPFDPISPASDPLSE